MNVTLIIILAVANVPIYLLVGKTWFGGWRGFVESLRFWFTPDIVSLFRGEYWQDHAESFRLITFLALCVGLIAAEYVTFMSVCVKPS